MKSIILLLISISLSFNSIASHMMGGEITWQCLGPSSSDSGKYIFTVKFYRDCNGILPTMGSLMVTNHPAITSIPLSPVAGSPFDISTAGCGWNCNNSPPVGTRGLVQEYIWKSTP